MADMIHYTRIILNIIVHVFAFPRTVFGECDLAPLLAALALSVHSVITVYV